MGTNKLFICVHQKTIRVHSFRPASYLVRGSSSCAAPLRRMHSRHRRQAASSQGQWWLICRNRTWEIHKRTLAKSSCQNEKCGANGALAEEVRRNLLGRHHRLQHLPKLGTHIQHTLSIPAPHSDPSGSWKGGCIRGIADKPHRHKDNGGPSVVIGLGKHTNKLDLHWCRVNRTRQDSVARQDCLTMLCRGVVPESIYQDRGRTHICACRSLVDLALQS